MQKRAKMHEIFREIKESVILENRERLDFPAHIHEDIELVLVKEGDGYAFCDGRKYRLSDNTFFMAFPNQVHRYEDCTQGEYLIFIIKPTDLLGYENVFLEGAPKEATWDCTNDGGTVYLANESVSEYEKNGFTTVVRAYLTALFGKLFENCEIEKNRENRNTVLRILQYCKAHFTEEITLGDVSEALHISKSSVSHIFSERLSMSFCDYINSLRLSEAVQLLKNKSYSMTEIASMSGFPTIRTFNRAFRKQYGTSPSEYRK